MLYRKINAEKKIALTTVCADGGANHFYEMMKARGREDVDVCIPSSVCTHPGYHYYYPCICICIWLCIHIEFLLLHIYVTYCIIQYYPTLLKSPPPLHYIILINETAPHHHNRRPGLHPPNNKVPLRVARGKRDLPPRRLQHRFHQSIAVYSRQHGRNLILILIIIHHPPTIQRK